MQIHPLLAERLRCRAGLASPSHPRCVTAGHDRLHGCHQPPRTTLPAAHPIGIDNTVNGETVCSNHQIERRPSHGHEPSPPCSRVWASLRARTPLGYVSARQRSNFAGILDESTRFLAATHVAGSLAIGFRRHEDGPQDRVDGRRKCEGSLGGGWRCTGPPDAGPPDPVALSRRRPRPPGPRRAPRPPDSWRAPRSGCSPNPSACPRSARDHGCRRRAGRRRLPRREVPARVGPLPPRSPRVCPENPPALPTPKSPAAVSPRLRNPFLTSPVQCRRSSGSARPPPHAAWHRWRGRIRRPNAARSGTGGTHRRPRRQEMWILLTYQFTASVTPHTTLPGYLIPLRSEERRVGK